MFIFIFAACSVASGETLRLGGVDRVLLEISWTEDGAASPTQSVPSLLGPLAPAPRKEWTPTDCRGLHKDGHNETERLYCCPRGVLGGGKHASHPPTFHTCLSFLACVARM